METSTINLAAISVLVGTFLPLAISLLKRSGWSTQAKQGFAIVMSIVTAVLATGIAQGWEITSWAEFWAYLLASAGAIYTVAQATYLNFWEDTSVEVLLDRI